MQTNRRRRVAAAPDLANAQGQARALERERLETQVLPQGGEEFVVLMIIGIERVHHCPTVTLIR